LFGTIVAVVWYGVQLSIGEISVGELFTFILYSSYGSFLGGIAELYAQMQKAIGATERVFELLEETPENISSKHNINTANKNNGTLLKRCFSYPSRKEIKVLKM
jgi:ABC-type multidrug transport system fused ATPase/permease subunit